MQLFYFFASLTEERCNYIAMIEFVIIKKLKGEIHFVF